MQITAKMADDHLAKRGFVSTGSKIPYILASDHPKHKVGSRFDWGFLQMAVEKGYTVTILPEKI